MELLSLGSSYFVWGGRRERNEYLIGEGLLGFRVYRGIRFCFVCLRGFIGSYKDEYVFDVFEFYFV